MVAGKRVLISEETIRADLLFDDADGVDCFPKQVIWDSLRDIGYEGLLDLYALNREKLKKRGKKRKKKVSSVKLGRNKDEGNLSEEHHDQDDHNHTTFVYENFDATDAVSPDLERNSDETEQVKSDETKHVLIEEEKDSS
ncbi:hypothetical protein Tco_0208193, partial [Tanacetum coccineum]